jgi:transcriptional regulator with XRE-family HTH domain
VESPSFRAEYEALEGEFAFIRQLIELRRQKGLTQAELAEQVGTRQPSISRLEHGQLGSFEFLRRVAEALDAQVEIRLAPKRHSSS